MAQSCQGMIIPEHSAKSATEFHWLSGIDQTPNLSGPSPALGILSFTSSAVVVNTTRLSSRNAAESNSYPYEKATSVEFGMPSVDSPMAQIHTPHKGCQNQPALRRNRPFG